MVHRLTLLLGIVLLLVGIIGFFGNPLVGQSGIFETNLHHDIIHILTGMVLIWLGRARGKKLSRGIKILGFVYLGVALLGFGSEGYLFNYVVINNADNYLHLAFALIFLFMGFVMKDRK